MKMTIFDLLTEHKLFILIPGKLTVAYQLLDSRFRKYNSLKLHLELIVEFSIQLLSRILEILLGDSMKEFFYLRQH